MTQTVIQTSLPVMQQESLGLDALTINATLVLQPQRKAYLVKSASRGVTSIRKYVAHLAYLYSQSTNRQTPVWVSVCERDTYVDRKGKTQSACANKAVVDIVNELPTYNSIIVNAHVGSTLLPVSADVYSESLSDNTEKAWSALLKLEKANVTAEKKAEMEQKIWEAYSAAEQAMVDQGILAEAHVLVPVQNGVIPVLTPNPLLRYKSDDLNVETLYGSRGITHFPSICTARGCVMLKDLSVDPYNPKFTMGMHSYENRDESERAIKVFTVTGKPIDCTYHESPSYITLSVADLPFSTPNGMARSEAFQNFCDANASIEITNGEFSIRTQGGKPWIGTFHIGGRDFSYRKAANRSGVAVTDVKVDVGEAIAIETDSNPYDAMLELL